VTKALFLPGAGGRRSFWEPLAQLLDPRIEPVVIAWPGFGDEPRNDSITSLQGLVDYVLSRMDEPCDLIAQSMGGVVALTLALHYPELVRRLVLTGTSGGIDVSRFGGEDWRGEALAMQVNGRERMPSWFVDDRTDLTSEIPTIAAPALLIWGEDDRISPPTAGEYLASLLPNARFEVVPGEHDHPHAHPEAVAGLIQPFLLAPAPSEVKAR
jgi:pimeloyl-ACP methyl ester carboxylesterase